MSALFVLLAALGGGVGAAARFVVDTLVTRAVHSRGAGGSGPDASPDGLVSAESGRGRTGPVPLPIGIVVVNVTGSFLLGLLVGAVDPATPAVALLGVGVLGGYTTFSTASLDAVRLARAGRWGSALGVGAGTMVVTVLAAAAGLWLGGMSGAG